MIWVDGWKPRTVSRSLMLSYGWKLVLGVVLPMKSRAQLTRRGDEWSRSGRIWEIVVAVPNPTPEGWLETEKAVPKQLDGIVELMMEYTALLKLMNIDRKNFFCNSIIQLDDIWSWVVHGVDCWMQRTTGLMCGRSNWLMRVTV